MRKLLTLLFAAIFLLAGQSSAAAGRFTDTTTVHKSECLSPCCDHSMPMQRHGAPCQANANCMAAASCFATPVIAAAAAPLLPPASTHSAFWPVQDPGPGLVLPPDNPPPIA